MSHRFLDGTIYHKRFLPKEHDFKYKFFMIDMDLDSIEDMDRKLISYNSFNLFSFYSKDHFGKSENFIENVASLLNRFDFPSGGKMRFITLPRIAGFVFNPISILVIFDKDTPTHMICEVHNYNGGRVVYPVELKTDDGKRYYAKCKKDMYVSPFFKRDGDYEFSISYDGVGMNLNVLLYEDGKKMLATVLKMDNLVYRNSSILKLFFKHTFLTFWVVTRTLYQTIRLKLKGLSWNSPIKQDQVRRV
jgi:DUF1365 family protein